MKPTLALSMIVKNGAEDLPHCLASVRGVADEIVIADTGSTDNSIAIAESFGARVVQIPWQDDFAAARNAALREVKSDWVLILDADEQLDDCAAQEIMEAMQRPGVVGYQVMIRNYVRSMNEVLWDKGALPNDGRVARANEFPGYLEHNNIRLFQNHPEIYFERRIHETVGDRVRATGAMGNAKFVIHHFGFAADADKKARKNKFYFDLGMRKLQDMPQSAQAHFELGLMEMDFNQNFEGALLLFAKACELDKGLAVAWYFQGQALLRLQRGAEALPCLQRSRQIGGINVAACLEAEGDAFYGCKQFEDSRRAYRQALKLTETAQILSKIGMAELRQGHVDTGLKKIQQAAAASNSADIYDRLITGLASTGRVADAAQAAETKLQKVGPSAAAFLRAAVLWAHAKDSRRALNVISAGIKEFPDAKELQAVSAELLRTNGGKLNQEGGQKG
jgi:tetratricopeptide (TPR) repeat protein